MFNWIRKFFTKKKKEIKPENVEHPDPMAREIIARCFNTGNIIIGSRNEDGTIEIHELDQTDK